jgi:hypothetical protein
VLVAAKHTVLPYGVQSAAAAAAADAAVHCLAMLLLPLLLLLPQALAPARVAWLVGEQHCCAVGPEQAVDQQHGGVLACSSSSSVGGDISAE